MSPETTYRSLRSRNIELNGCYKQLSYIELTLN